MPTNTASARRSAALLLSEGSSLTARQTISALGPLGYTLDLCDTNPWCMGRFSRFVRRVYRCPAMGADPEGYLAFIQGRIAGGDYDALLPVHEQAFLFARMQRSLGRQVGLALPPFESLTRLQSKAAFARTLLELGLPQPRAWFIHTESELAQISAFPCYLKAPYSTAGNGVWRVRSAADLPGVIATLGERGLLDGQTELVAQAAASGDLSQAQAVFERGRLIAVHCTSQRAEGVGGSQSARLSVDHPAVREHLATLGRALDWHGALVLDYLYDRAEAQPYYIEANPRLVEPMNAVLSGVNLADILAQLSLGRSFAAEPLRVGRFGVRSHSLAATLLGQADGGASRRDLLRLIGQAATRRGVFADSAEDLTPARLDPPSLIALGVVSAAVLLDPANAKRLAGRSVADYALSPRAVERILALDE